MLLGTVVAVGRRLPSDVSGGMDEPETTEVDIERELVSDVICRTPRIDAGDSNSAELVGADVEFVVVEEEKLRVIVEDDGTLVITLGIAIGQKLQTFLPSSQYKSISNLRKPTARRLERQFPDSSSSYRRLGKQIDEKETPGVVTKLMGTLIPRSR